MSFLAVTSLPLTMCKITLILACLACTSGGWRVQLPANSPKRYMQADAGWQMRTHRRQPVVLAADASPTQSRRKRDVVKGMFTKVGNLFGSAADTKADTGARKPLTMEEFFDGWGSGAPAPSPPVRVKLPARSTVGMDWFDDMIKDPAMQVPPPAAAGAPSHERTRKRDIAKAVLKNMAQKRLGADYLSFKAEEADAEMKARADWIENEHGPSAESHLRKEPLEPRRFSEVFKESPQQVPASMAAPAEAPPTADTMSGMDWMDEMMKDKNMLVSPASAPPQERRRKRDVVKDMFKKVAHMAIPRSAPKAAGKLSHGAVTALYEKREAEEKAETPEKTMETKVDAVSRLEAAWMRGWKLAKGGFKRNSK